MEAGLDSEKARLRRMGVIDVGSNSVRLVVFDGMARSPAYFYNEKVLCGLGQGLGETGRLSPEGWTSALAALHRFMALAARMNLSGLVAVATAAVRDAIDGPAFCAQVENETGLQLQVATGAEEARLSAMGVLLGWPHATGLVSDMGGSSMELAHLDNGEILECETAALGPFKVKTVAEPEERIKYIRRQVKSILRKMNHLRERLFLVGGSWRAIGRLHMARVGYPLTVLHGYEPDIEALLETLQWIPDQDVSVMSAQTGTSVARLSLVPTVAPVLAELIRRVEPQRIVLSAYGLREGLLFRQMPEPLRRLDPLIEMCRHEEQTSARMPGFGESLYEWLLPLYREAGPAELRLIRAAALLHDVNWRAHPDYRAETCLATITRANIAGVDHAERIFLGLALLNRYKINAPGEVIARYEALLSDAQSRAAAILGRALRLGAMLSGSVPGVLEHTELRLDEARLSLVLRGNAREVMGEAVVRRLNGLGSRLDRKTEVVLDA